MISLLNGPVYLPPHVREALAQPVCDVRHPRFKEAYAYSRSQTAVLLGAPGYETVLAAGSGTFGVELILRSCLQPTDKVLALVMGTFSARMAKMAEHTGAQVHREWAHLGDIVSLQRLDDLLSDLRPSFVLFAHVEPSTATQTNIEKVAALCRRHGAIPIIDGVCAGFALEVNCAKDRIGAYVTASQKGLSLPPGMAVAVVSPEMIDRAKHIPESKTGVYGRLKHWISTSPSFTPPMAHIFALEKSLQYIMNETIPERAKRHRRYSQYVARWAEQRALKPVPVNRNVSAWTLSAFYYPLGLNDAWLIRLRDNKGLELAPSNDARLPGAYFRIGHLGDLPQEHLTEGLEILDAALRSNPEPVGVGKA